MQRFASALRFTRLLLIAAVVIAGVMMIGGCGGGSSASGGGSSPSGPSSVGSKVPSHEFMKKGRENRWASFGEVASEDEREAASKVLEGNLRARQAGEWEAQCASLTRKAMKEQAPTPGDEPLVKACAKSLKGMARPLKVSAAVRKDNLTGEIDILRIKDERGVALFHGQGSTDYAMSMEKEDGEWKVAALLTEELN